ncbi:hypothetical protein ACWD5B_22945 [Streptomyces tanashiensis]
MPDFGAMLGAVGRGVVGVGRLAWAVLTAPTLASEWEVEGEVTRLSDLIGREVPEELHGRAWGLVMDRLRGIDEEIERMTQEETEDGAADAGTS